LDCRNSDLLRYESNISKGSTWYRRGVDLIWDALPFGRLAYAGPNAAINAIDYAKFRSRSHRAVIRVYDSAGNVIETHEHAGDFEEGIVNCRALSAARVCRSIRRSLKRFYAPAARPIRKAEPQTPDPSANDDGRAALGKVISKILRNLESPIP